jgi:pimeloyl-ACP methyl ester carboxylesterase
MSNYVQLGDVHTYYEEDGAGEPLVLLHPGLADSRAFEDYVPELAQHFHVFRPDRRGHGRTPDVEGPITYQLMAQDTIAFLEQVVGGPASLLGPQRRGTRRVAGRAGATRPRPQAGPQRRRLPPRRLGTRRDRTRRRDDRLPHRLLGRRRPDGPDPFPVVKAKLDRMHRKEPTLTVADLADYPGPALVMVGDSDEEIPIDHTLALHRGLPNAQLAVLPGTGHGGIDARIVINFLTERQEDA